MTFARHSSPILLIAILPVIALLMGCSDHGERQFDAAEWRNADTMSSRARGEMLDDLRSEHSLKGLTRGQVEALLGPVTATDKFQDWSMVYATGPAGWDTEWLVLRLDGQGRVTEYTITSD